jgi:glycine betaine/choline ABC-type transport system substrate-binding protein
MRPTTHSQHVISRILSRASSALIAVVLLVGCGEREPSIRIGVKPFDEQFILGQMTAQLLEGAGYKVDDIVACRDTYGCHKRLRSGDIDMMVEYSGTGLLFMGKTVLRDGRALERARLLYREVGLQWLGSLGFDNSYRVVVRTDRAAALEMTAIDDLQKIEGGIRITCPAEYLRRPVDGLYALLRTYGLSNKLAADPLLLADPERRYRALLDGKVHVAIGYATDGSIQDPRLTVLKDTKSFFPPYEAALVVRKETLEKYPRLRAVLDKLEKHISTRQMREMNYAVQVEGRSPRVVALEFLKSKDLLDKMPSRAARKPELGVVLHPKDDFGRMRRIALQSAKQAFSSRTVRLRLSDEPVTDLARGRARLAILGAERFFETDSSTPDRDERAEAVAVLGTRVVHLVRRSGDTSDILAGKIGVSPRSSGSARVGKTILKGAGKEPAEWAETADLLKKVRAGELDGAIVLTDLGDLHMVRAMKEGGLRLFPLSKWMTPQRRPLVPYLRPMEIPKASYPGQPAPVDSFAAQVVLAAPARSLAAPGASGGQAAALPTAGIPLPRDKMESLVEAVGLPETPDPVLPSAWAATPLERKRKDPRVTVGTKLLNALVIAFLVWLVWIVVRKEEDEEEKEPAE